MQFLRRLRKQELAATQRGEVKCKQCCEKLVEGETIQPYNPSVLSDIHPFQFICSCQVPISTLCISSGAPYSLDPLRQQYPPMAKIMFVQVPFVIGIAVHYITIVFNTGNVFNKFIFIWFVKVMYLVEHC